MSKMNSMLMGIWFLLSSLFSCQQSKGDFKTVPVKEFASLIQDERTAVGCPYNGRVL